MRVTTCPQCQSHGVPESAVFCPSCGNRLDGKSDNGFAVAGIIVGIIGGALFWLPFVGVIISAVGVGLAIPAANKQQRLYEWALGITLLGVLVGLTFSLVPLGSPH